MLLDSNALLFLSEAQPRISAEIRHQIVSTPRIFISVATVWELEIKRGLAKIIFPIDDWYGVVERGMEIISVDIRDAVRAGKLPMHHRDPFDRMIIAQALNRGLVIATRDRVFERYGVPILRL